MYHQDDDVRAVINSQDLECIIDSIPTDELWALLRPVMPTIDRRIREDGVRHQRIVEVLNAKGLKISLTTFRTYISRWRTSQRGSLDLEDIPVNEERNVTSKQVINCKYEFEGGYVYFIYSERDSLIKIGYSISPQERFRSICQGYPVPLVLMKVVPGTLDYESALHEQFSHLRHKGEWFAAEQELLDFIESLSVESSA